MKTVLKHAKRQLGDVEPVKVRFSINILDIIIPTNDKHLTESSILSVCFERGGKLNATSDFGYNVLSSERLKYKDGNSAKKKSDIREFNEFMINQTLELIVTLYKDKKTGKFHEKQGKLYLRQKVQKSTGMFSRGGGSTDSYEGIAICNLKLDSLLLPKELNGLKLKLPLDMYSKQSSKSLSELLSTKKVDAHRGVLLKVQIMTDEVVFADDGDDMSVCSMYSDASDMSLVGAHFSREDHRSLSRSSSFNSEMSIDSSANNIYPATSELNVSSPTIHSHTEISMRNSSNSTISDKYSSEQVNHSNSNTPTGGTSSSSSSSSAKNISPSGSTKSAMAATGGAAPGTGATFTPVGGNRGGGGPGVYDSGEKRSSKNNINDNDNNKNTSSSSSSSQSAAAMRRSNSFHERQLQRSKSLSDQYRKKYSYSLNVEDGSSTNANAMKAGGDAGNDDDNSKSSSGSSNTRSSKSTEVANQVMDEEGEYCDPELEAKHKFELSEKDTRIEELQKAVNAQEGRYKELIATITGEIEEVKKAQKRWTTERDLFAEQTLELMKMQELQSEIVDLHDSLAGDDMSQYYNNDSLTNKLYNVASEEEEEVGGDHGGNTTATKAVITHSIAHKNEDETCDDADGDELEDLQQEQELLSVGHKERGKAKREGEIIQPLSSSAKARAAGAAAAAKKSEAAEQKQKQKQKKRQEVPAVSAVEAEDLTTSPYYLLSPKRRAALRAQGLSPDDKMAIIAATTPLHSATNTKKNKNKNSSKMTYNNSSTATPATSSRASSSSSTNKSLTAVSSDNKGGDSAAAAAPAEKVTKSSEASASKDKSASEVSTESNSSDNRKGKQSTTITAAAAAAAASAHSGKKKEREERVPPTLRGGGGAAAGADSDYMSSSSSSDDDGDSVVISSAAKKGAAAATAAASSSSVPTVNYPPPPFLPSAVASSSDATARNSNMHSAAAAAAVPSLIPPSHEVSLMMRVLSDNIEQKRAEMEAERDSAHMARAATLAAQQEGVLAGMKVKRAEDETEQILLELINAKVSLADMAIEEDKMNKLLRSAKSRLRHYARQISTMELQYCTANGTVTPINLDMKSGSGVYAFYAAKATPDKVGPVAEREVEGGGGGNSGATGADDDV